jgi:hypothetical protein
VILPDLQARIEERDEAAGSRIDSLYRRLFVDVAPGAAKAEVLRVSLAAADGRYNMINSKILPRHFH